MGGYNMVLYLAGLKDVDPALYEAAAIDGAGRLAMFRHVTWPQLAPTTFFIVVTNVIGGFQVFDQAYIMTVGGPEGATTTIVYYIYDLLYVSSDTGYAATVAIALFGLIFLVTIANWYAGKKLAAGTAPA
jgi:multiple sugar transport system permease protein